MIWETPNALAFVDRIHLDLSEGKNVVCVLPSPQLEDDFTPTLDERLFTNGQGRLIRLDTTCHNGVIDLISLFKVGWNWDDEGISSDDLPNNLESIWHYFTKDDIKFVVLTGLDKLPLANQDKISKHVSAWARLSQQRRTNGQKQTGLRFLILVSPNFPNISSDLCLAVHHWWAQTDIVDHQWALNRFLIDNPPQNLAMDCWLKAICQALAYYDWTMLKLIIDDPPLNFDQIKAHVRRHPLFIVGQTAHYKYTRHTQLLKPLSLTPPRPPARGAERSLWAVGLFSYGPHHFPHPVLMDDDQLKFCLSLGQRQVILPVVDHVQNMLRQTIESLFGEGIWNHYEQDELKRSSIMAEISPLAFFINDIIPRSIWPKSSERVALVDMAFAWREIRNTLAHNNMLGFRQLELAFERYNTCYWT